MKTIPYVGLKAITLTPFHYHSVAVPSGTATLPEFIGDRAMSFAIAAAVGCLRPSPVLPSKNHLAHMSRLPGLASIFETNSPKLLRPLGKRLNLDAEMGASKSIQDATGTGNLKTWFFIQEVPAGVEYEGAVFGYDPFEFASQADGKAVHELTLRVGRHLSGIIKLVCADIPAVRLNAHTALTFGRNVSDVGIKVDRFSMYDLQPTEKIDISKASGIVGGWTNLAAAA